MEQQQQHLSIISTSNNLSIGLKWGEIMKKLEADIDNNNRIGTSTLSHDEITKRYTM